MTVYASVTLSTESWALITAALDVLATVTTPEKAIQLQATADALSAGVKRSLTDHANGDACPTCDVGENAPNPACASWVHPGNGPSQNQPNGSAT
ncbi:hypothetical protein QE392_001405 [Microbacterium proteolyticum]|nr:hypothetical protein [Microbacterium proteolyticum]